MSAEASILELERSRPFVVPRWVRVLLTFSIISSCAGASRASDAGKQAAAVPRPDSLAGDRAKDNEEILGPGFGKFIFIPGGEFTMGRNNGEKVDEKPEHLVELSPFYVGRTPVTNGQFVPFLNQVGIKQEEYLCSKKPWTSGEIAHLDGKWACVPGAEHDAACGESWILAERYCEWLSEKTGRKCRLPTEAEWEYVCRGKEGRKFPWGNNENDLESKTWRWRRRAYSNRKFPVGSFPKGATPEGVCDLIGYMDEICSDWYDPKYYARSPKKNPKGPSEPGPYGNAKVTRGGLQRIYPTEPGIVGFLRKSEFFGVLPSTYLPRGWSRGKAAPPRDLRFVYGRLGFRIVVEVETVSRPQ